MQVDGGVADVGVAEQELDGAQVCAGFHQVGGKTVPPMPLPGLCREDQNDRPKALGIQGVLARQSFNMRHSPEARDQSCLRKASNSSSG
jgi:hypothetical protein